MKVEPIATNEDEYEKYQREQMEEDLEVRAHPKPTEQYEQPIGPERPQPTSFREKVESKAMDIKESIKSAPTRTYEKIKSGIGNIKKNYEEEVEYGRKRAKVEREVKSSPEYLSKKAEHELRMEEVRARSRPTPRRGSTMATPSLIKMRNYIPAYSGKSTIPRAGFGGNYQPAYTGQIMSMGTPSVVKAPVKKLTPVKITSFGSGAMPKMGNFGGSSLMPKIGGSGKKMETPKIGFSFGEIPKIGKSITHKGSVRSIGFNTNINPIGDIPKIGFGLKKKTVKRKVKRKGRKK
jgi:hypothetical protein